MDQQLIAKKVKSFPGIPGAAAKLLTLLDDPDTDVSLIENTVKYDPGLTANILKLTNSAYFGFPSKIGSIKQATLLLGPKRMIQLVVTSCVNAILQKPVPGYGLPGGELLRHSIAVSVAAEGLVKELDLQAADMIFTAALLHDIGKLVLGGFLDKELAEIEAAAGGDVSFEKAERKVLGTDHAAVGAQILEGWSFPDEIVDAVRWHHDPPEDANRSSPMIDAVHVANVLCLMIGIGVGVEGLQYEPSDAATERLGVKPIHLEMVASRTLQWMAELSDVLQTT